MIDALSPELRVLGARKVFITNDFGDGRPTEKISHLVIHQLEDGRYEAKIFGEWYPVKIIAGTYPDDEEFTMYRKIGKPYIPGF